MDTGARCQNAEKPLFQNNRPCWGPHSTTNRKHSFHQLIAIAGAIFSQLANTEESNLEGRGKELLDARCAHCHAIARTGESPHSAAPLFRTLSRKYPIDELAESHSLSIAAFAGIRELDPHIASGSGATTDYPRLRNSTISASVCGETGKP